MNFGNIVVGSSSTQTVTITNTGGNSTSIANAVATGSGFSFTGPAIPISLRPGQSATFSVTFLPSSTGAKQGALSVSDTTKGSVTVSLMGTGVQAASPAIAITPSTLNFGNVPVGATSTQTVTVSNTGNANLDITQMTGPGNGFGVSGLGIPLTLSAGQSTKFSVTFAPSIGGSTSSALSLSSNAPISPTSLPLAGSGVQQQAQITVLPGNVSFGSVTVGNNGKQSVTVSNTGNATLTISAESVSGAGFSVAGLSIPSSIAAGATATITVYFAPSAAGAVNGSLSLTSNAPGSPTSIVLSGTGTAQSPLLNANPSALSFGSETVGSASTAQSFTLTNSSGSQSITINSIAVSGAFSVSGATAPLTLNPGGSLPLNVKFTPTASGLTTGTITVSSNAGNSPATIGLSGSGVAASPSLTPSGPIVVSNQNGTVIQGLRITSSVGDCVQITNSTNITIQNSEIGPCAGNGVNITGGNGIQVYDSYIHPETQSPDCCDNNDGIFSHDGTQNLTIQGNVIAYGESNIETLDSSNVIVSGNFLLNPRNDAVNPSRGQNFQCWQGGRATGCSNITVQDNYALSSQDTTRYLYPESQEDSINFGYTNGAIVQNNFVTGGHSPSGCGLIADSAANTIHFLNNLVLNTGQCGIGIADGTNQLVDSNKVYNTNPVSGGGNTAIYTWKQYSGACGPTTVSNNIADEIKPDGTHSGFWDGGGCSTTLTGNIFNQAADTSLTPIPTVYAPPLIPPKPKNCVVISPYSTQNSMAACVP